MGMGPVCQPFLSTGLSKWELTRRMVSYSIGVFDLGFEEQNIFTEILIEAEWKFRVEKSNVIKVKRLENICGGKKKKRSTNQISQAL